MAGLIEAVNGRSYACGRAASALYLTNGDATDWTFAEAGVPSYTVELPPVDVEHGSFFNAEADIDGIFRENLPAMLPSPDGPSLRREETASPARRRSRGPHR